MGPFHEVQWDKDCIGHYVVFGILDEFLKQSVANLFVGRL